METEQQLDLPADRPDGYCENMADCKLALCGCRWEQTGSPWADEQQQSEAQSWQDSGNWQN